ncbi:MAG TPA: putative glycoside hydrolase [Candidatus Omnitrophota bacterium]|nr:putative glycoside hydrolase [Candidatus Omnitrophota bacterium]
MKTARYAVFAACLVLILLFMAGITHEVFFLQASSREKRTSDRGIYVTYWVAKTPRRFEELKAQAKAAGIDTLVIDAKEILSDPILKLVREKKLTADAELQPNLWLKNLADELHNEGFILTARLVTFKDDHLVLARNDLGVQAGGGLYRDRKGGKWADPYSDEVRLYNELIAETAAMSGVDEVQFDYIRFPAEGEAKNATYPHLKKDVSKVDIICSFLNAVRERVGKYKVSVAVDIFGVTAWQSKNDIASLGQDLQKMAKYIDVLSPMLYPSHFHDGYDGYSNPGAYPYHFINAGVLKTKAMISNEAVAVVPWIQGFNMRSPNYGPGYITDQIKAAHDAGTDKYLIWNARNVYDVPFAGMRK